MIRIYETTTNLQSCCWLRVAAGTTGKHGGDGGHGCLTVVEIQDAGTAADIGVEKLKRGVRLILGGDCELDAIIEAFEFIVNKLKNGQIQQK